MSEGDGDRVCGRRQRRGQDAPCRPAPVQQIETEKLSEREITRTIDSARRGGQRRGDWQPDRKAT